MSELVEMFSYSFVVRALVVGVLVSLVAALIGAPLVLRKKSMIGDGLSHTAFAAVAIGVVFGMAPLAFALPVVIVASFLVLRISKARKMDGDALIAVLSVASLAIGTIAISVSQGVNIDLNSYLFGSILSVGWSEVWLSLAVAVGVVIFYIISFHKIFAITFDAEFAEAIGIKTGLYDGVFAAICSVVVVLGMKLLGALLISGLIIFPTLIAMQIKKSFRGVVITAAVVAVVNFVLGLVISYFAVLPTGATVVAVNLVGLFIAFLWRKLKNKD
jgi:zinc transport system permease protein